MARNAREPPERPSILSLTGDSILSLSKDVEPCQVAFMAVRQVTDAYALSVIPSASEESSPSQRRSC